MLARRHYSPSFRAVIAKRNARPLRGGFRSKQACRPGATLTDAKNLYLRELSALPDPSVAEKNDAL